MLTPLKALRRSAVWETHSSPVPPLPSFVFSLAATGSTLSISIFSPAEYRHEPRSRRSRESIADGGAWKVRGLVNSQTCAWPRPAILRVASELDGIRRISALHHHSFKEIAAQTAVDRFQASVEIWHGIPIVPDRGRQEQGVLGERLPLARGQARDSEADPLGRVGRTQPVTPCGCG